MMAIDFRPLDNQSAEKIDFQPIDFQPDEPTPQESGFGRFARGARGFTGHAAQTFANIPGQLVNLLDLPVRKPLEYLTGTDLRVPKLEFEPTTGAPEEALGDVAGGAYGMLLGGAGANASGINALSKMLSPARSGLGRIGQGALWGTALSDNNPLGAGLGAGMQGMSELAMSGNPILKLAALTLLGGGGALLGSELGGGFDDEGGNTGSTIGAILGAFGGMAPGVSAKMMRNPLQSLRNLPGELSQGIRNVPQDIKDIPANALIGIFGGNASPADLAANVAASEGLQTPIGEIIESPHAKQFYENTLSKMFGSGAPESAKATQSALQTQAADVPAKFIGTGNPQNFKQDIVESFENVYKQAQTEKNALYDEANAIADKSGFTIDAPNITSTIQDINLNRAPLSPEAKSFLRKARTKPEVVTEAIGVLDAQGKPIVRESMQEAPKLSLKEANIVAGELRAASESFSKSPIPHDRFMAKKYGEAAKALKNDIQQSIETKGSPELKGAFKEAQQNYATNFSEFLDRDLYKLSHAGTDQQKAEAADKVISSFLSLNKNTDEAAKVTKLLEKLPQKDKDLFKYGILERHMVGSPESRTLDMRKFARFWESNSLGVNQKKALFTKSERDQFDKMVRQVKLNPQAANPMFNPPTGQTVLTSALNFAVPASSGNLMTALPTMGVQMVGANILNKFMTSPQSREYIVNALMRQKGRLSPKAAINPLIPGVAPSMQEGNDNQ